MNNFAPQWWWPSHDSPPLGLLIRISDPHACLSPSCFKSAIYHLYHYRTRASSILISIRRFAYTDTVPTKRPPPYEDYVPPMKRIKSLPASSTPVRSLDQRTQSSLDYQPRLTIQQHMAQKKQQEQQEQQREHERLLQRQHPGGFSPT